MPIYIHRKHHLTFEEARSQVALAAEDLAVQLKIKYNREGDRITFKRTGLKGHIDVDPFAVRVHLDRNPLLPVSDAWLKAQVEEYLDLHLPPSPEAPLAGEPAPETPPPRVQSPEPPSEEAPREEAPREDPQRSLVDRLTSFASDLTSSAVRLAAQTGEAAMNSAPYPTAREVLPTLGAFLRSAREEAGLTLEAFSKLLGLPDETALGRIEQDRAPVSLEMMLQMVQQLAPKDRKPFLIALLDRSPLAGASLLSTLLKDKGLAQREAQFLALLQNQKGIDVLDEEAFAAALKLTGETLARGVEWLNNNG